MSNPGCTPEYNQRTRELQEQLEALRAKLRDAQRDVTRQKQLSKQTEELKQKAAQGREQGYLNKPDKREPIQYNRQTQDAIAKRDAIKHEIEAYLEKGERLNMSPGKKILDLIHAQHLFNIFTSPFVYPKLAAAVLGGHLHSLLSSATISAMRAIPAFRRIADMSERYGAGLTAKGLAARYGEGAKASLPAAGQTFLKGHSNIEAAEGNVGRASDSYVKYMGTLSDALSTPGFWNKAYETTRYFQSLPGRTHGVIKAFLSTPEYFHARADISLQMERQMKKSGMTPEQIQQAMNSEATQASIGAKAIAHAYESKMQGKNAFADAVSGFIARMDKSDNFGANLLGFVAKSVLPVARVGVNVFKQGTSILPGGGLVKAGIEAAAKKAMTPERADYIVKNLGAQGTGLVMVGLGVVLADYLGGVPGAQSKQQQKASGLSPDEANVGGTPVGAYAFHGAPAAMLQIGASLKKVYESELKGKMDPTDAALVSLGKTMWNWSIRTIPETDQIRRTANTLEYGRGKGKYGTAWGEVVGDQLRSMLVPLAVQQYAKSEDPYKGYRDGSRSIKQDIELGIPGLRETVPKR